MTITKRLTKGSALSYQELDENFTDLDGRVNTLNSSIVGISSRVTALENESAASNVPVRLTQNYAAVVRDSNGLDDIDWVSMALITVPGGTMNLSGEIVMTQDWKYTSSTNKILATDWGGTNIAGPTVANASRVTWRIAIKNTGSLAEQSILNNINFGSAAADIITTKNTENDVVIDIKTRWSANVTGTPESITLIGYSLWYYPGDN